MPQKYERFYKLASVGLVGLALIIKRARNWILNTYDAYVYYKIKIKMKNLLSLFVSNWLGVDKVKLKTAAHCSFSNYSIYLW